MMEEDNHSDDELVEKRHSQLLQTTSAAYGKKCQRIKPPTRNEPSLEISEFNLSGKRKKKESLLTELTTSLNRTGKHAQVTRQVKKLHTSVKPIPAPLERQEAEKIKRTIAYDATKSLLAKWEPVVVANRVADQLVFPLNTPYFRLTSTKTFLNSSRGQTPLEKEVENVLSCLTGMEKKEQNDDSKKTFFLNKKEIMEQRCELARTRAQQSYREAKARQQNKIKSKRYHRIARRESTKKQIREFEEMMKVDPEGALKKLEELEKTRAEERITLRHRSTGQWARNKAVHAKYDKQSREMLAQQLRLSKELTQKVNISDSSDDEDIQEEKEVKSHENNPWMQKGSNEYQEFTLSFRKYWDEQQKKEQELKCSGEIVSSAMSRSESTLLNPDKEDGFEETVGSKGAKNMLNGGMVTKFGFVVSDVEDESISRKRNCQQNAVSYNWKCTELKEDVTVGKKINAQKSVVNNDWKCVLQEDSQRNGEKSKQKSVKSKRKVDDRDTVKRSVGKDLDDMFEEMEVTLREKAQKVISSIKVDCESEPELEKREEKKKSSGKGMTDSLEGLQRRKKLPHDVNVETVTNPGESNESNQMSVISSAIHMVSKTGPASQKKNDVSEIDPKKFLTLDATKLLNTGIPSLTEDGDDDENAAAVENYISIAEAFTEDDVVTEFRQEKEAVIEENKPKDVDLTLPGWGEWAGKDISPGSQSRRNRFKLWTPKHIPRKDDRKDTVIINENADSKARPHQVNELPFPFVGVESFEASIRAPIGTTWIPEVAHDKLVKPKVTTLLGAVIEPLTEDALLDESEMKEGLGNEDEEVFIPEEL